MQSFRNQADSRLSLLAGSIVFALSACRPSPDAPEPTGVSDTIRVFAWPAHPLPTDEVLTQVGDTFGMEVVVSDNWIGSIAIYYTEFVDDAAFEGLATSTTCSPHIVMHPTSEVVVLAHEIGHTLGLQHVGTPGNLMNVDDVEFALSDGQIEVARSSAWEMEQCKE